MEDGPGGGGSENGGASLRCRPPPGARRRWAWPGHPPTPASRAAVGFGRAQPPALCRQVFALIVFSCIFGEGYSNTHSSQQKYCVFNRNEDACRYGGAIGVLAFMACAAFLVVDVYFPQISNATDRKYLVISDLLFSGTCQAQRAPVSGAGAVPRSCRGL